MLPELIPAADQAMRAGFAAKEASEVHKRKYRVGPTTIGATVRDNTMPSPFLDYCQKQLLHTGLRGDVQVLARFTRRRSCRNGAARLCSHGSRLADEIDHCIALGLLRVEALASDRHRDCTAEIR